MLTIYEREAIREYSKQTKRMANNVLNIDAEPSSTATEVQDSLHALEKLLKEYQEYLREVIYER